MVAVVPWFVMSVPVPEPVRAAATAVGCRSLAGVSVPDVAVARAVAVAKAGGVEEIGGPIVGVWAARSWLTMPVERLPGCPLPVRDDIDDWSLQVTAWATPELITAAAGTARVGWLSRFTTGAHAIDVRVFTAVAALVQGAFDSAISLLGDAVITATGDPALKASFRRMSLDAVLDDVVQRGVFAALGVKDRKIIETAANRVGRQVAAELEAAGTATSGLLADEVGDAAAAGFEEGRTEREAAAVAALVVAFTAELDAKVNTPTQPDTDPETHGVFPAAVLWAVLSIAGGADPAGRVLVDGVAVGGPVLTGPGVASGPTATSSVLNAVRSLARRVVGVSRSDAVKIADEIGVNSAVVDAARAVAVDRLTPQVVKTWRHVTPYKRRFDPHFKLEGTRTDIGAAELDLKLRNTKTFPDNGQYFPGDHPGCACRWDTTIELVTGIAA